VFRTSLALGELSVVEGQNAGNIVISLWRSSFVAITVLVALPNGSALAQPMEKIRVAVSFVGLWTSSQPTFCRDRGEFRKAGLDVDIVSTRGGSENVQAVLTGAVDIGYGPGIASVLAAAMQGANIKLISSGFVGQSDSFFYVRSDSPIKSIEDLKGKTLAFTRPGAVSEAILLALKTERKIDFKTVSGGAMDAIFAMTMTKQIDVGYSVPPFGLDAERKGDIRVVFNGDAIESQRDVVSRVNIANSDFVRLRREIAVRFLKVLNQCIAWMYENKTEGVKIYAALNKIDEGVASGALIYYPQSKMTLAPLLGFDAAIKQAIGDKFIDKAPTQEQIKGLVDILYQPGG
jgi:NitT/TauT family transport system substrate-binding protein